MKRMEGLIIGYDLGRDYAQMSCYNEKTMEAESLGPDPDNGIKLPLILCQQTEEVWLYGDEAQDAVDSGMAEAITGFGEKLKEIPELTAGGKIYRKEALLHRFIQMSMAQVAAYCGKTAIAVLTFTTDYVDAHMAGVLRAAGMNCGVAEENILVQSHLLSYEYFAFSQKKELWTHDIGMFTYDDNGLYYQHLSVTRKSAPVAVTVYEANLCEYLDGESMHTLPEPERDRKLWQAVKEVTAKKTISVFYLMGEGFKTTTWMNVALRQMCSMHRKVFQGVNLYAKGACYAGSYKVFTNEKPPFIALNADIISKDIYIRTMDKKTPRTTMLVPAGMPWYNISGQCEVIADECDTLIIHIREFGTNFEQQAAATLMDMPKRPARMTRLRIETAFDSPSICRIKVTDMGFGEFFEASGKVWESTFDISDDSLTPALVEQGRLLEFSAPPEKVAYDFRLAGIRVYNMEELCCYIYRNIYAVNDAFFEESLLYWIGKVCLIKGMVLSIKNLIRSGKPLKDTVRFVLNGVNYLMPDEISKVYALMTDMEHQNATEIQKINADNCYRYGHYLNALKLYQRVVYQMNYMEEDITRIFKSCVYHNMGMTYLALNNASAAAECMRRAYDETKDKQYLKECLLMLKIAGKTDRFLDMINEVHALPALTDEILKLYNEAVAAYEVSERGQAVKEGMALKNSGDVKGYWNYVSKYISEKREEFAERTR